MEDMDLVILPSRREITVNPENPSIPHARVKSIANPEAKIQVFQSFITMSNVSGH